MGSAYDEKRKMTEGFSFLSSCEMNTDSFIMSIHQLQVYIDEKRVTLY